MTGIYCITNNTNGKCYVGKSVNIESRIRHHQQDYLNPKSSQYNTYFYNALRKYGWDSFTCQVLEECDEKDLNTKERYWIKQLKSNHRDRGYNRTNGGDGVSGYWDISVYQYDLDGKFVGEYKSMSDAERQLNINGISACCRGVIKTAGGYMWSTVKKDYIEKYHKNHRTSVVYQYGLEGEFLAMYNSILEASNLTETPYKKILSCITDKRQTRGGDFMWTRQYVNKLPPYKHGCRKKTPVIQKTLDDTVLQIYESLNEAQRATGVKSGNIWRCCHHKAKTAGGYLWEYTLNNKEDE